MSAMREVLKEMEVEEREHQLVCAIQAADGRINLLANRIWKELKTNPQIPKEQIRVAWQELMDSAMDADVLGLLGMEPEP